MPHRFHTTTTNRLVQLASKPDHEDFHRLFEMDRQIQNQILKFNLGVENSFTQGGIQGLQECCTPAGLERMQQKYDNWKSQQVIALNLLSCDFLSFNLTPNQERATAFTFEKWAFVYSGGKEIQTGGSVDGYELHLLHSQWLIDSVIFYAPNPEPQ